MIDVTESNTPALGATSVDLKEDIIPNNNQNPAVRSFSELDQYLERTDSSALEESWTETEAYDETAEPVPADFAVDLSKLTTEEVADLLRHTKEIGEARRAENAKELMVFNKTLTNLEEKLERKMKGLVCISSYTKAMKTDLPLPTYVMTNQIQLCRTFHVNEIYMNQIKKMQKRNKKVISFLTKQVKVLKEESKRREDPLRADVDVARKEVVRMCRILEIDPDDWKKSQENELMQMISDVYSDV